jgi:hypothetical protein
MISNNVADLAWLAGIIDGEGSIFVMRQPRKDRERGINYILRISVDSTDPFMAPACKTIAGGCSIQQSSDRRENCSDRLKWQVNGKQAVRVLEAILPYMRVKKEQAALAVDFQTTTKKHWKHMTVEDYTKQERLYHELRAAKQTLKLGKTKQVGALSHEAPLSSSIGELNDNE